MRNGLRAAVEHRTRQVGIFLAPLGLVKNGDVQVVAVANDITFSSGSFGPREDTAFRAATEYALEERIPLIYLAANSGARVGLANEVKQALKVTRSPHVVCRQHKAGR